MTQEGDRQQFGCTCADPARECRDHGQSWRYKFCNSLRRYLFTRCRFPAFTSDYIRRHVDAPNTSAEDLRAYMENSSETRRNKALIIVCVYLTYCLKNLFVPFETLRMFDYDDYESNIKLQVGVAGATPAESGEIIKYVTCLATNCSHLSPYANGDDETPPEEGKSTSRLAEDISKLPMFQLCHPALSAWYSPVPALDSLGVLIMLCVSFNGFLLGAWITIQQLTFPAGNEMIMFIVAPAATARTAWRRTRQLLASVSVSYAHFCLNSKLRFFTQTEREYLTCSVQLASLEPSGAPIKRRRRRRRRKTTQQLDDEENEEGAVEQAARALKPQRSDRELDCMTSECLPIIRTCWWRRAVTSIFLCILAATAIEVLALSGVGFSYIQKRLAVKYEQLAAFAREMRRQNCQLWYARDQEQDRADPVQARQLIDLSRLELTWTIFSRIENGLFNVMPALGVSVMFAYYWAFISEIEIWLAELRTFLVATLVVSRVKLSQAKIVSSFSDNCDGDLLLATPASGVQLSMRPRTFTNAGIGVGSRGRASASLSGYAAPLASNRAQQTSRIKTKHFYNITYLRQQFQQEIINIGMAYYTRVHRCHIRPADRVVVHASQSRAHDSNAKIVFKMREIKFMELIDKQLRQQDQQTTLTGRPAVVRHDPSHLAQSTTGSHLLSGREWYTEQANLSMCEHTTETGDDEGDLAHDLYTMEQVYVNFRLFVEHVHALAPSMGVVLVVTYLLNYGIVCISVMCNRKFSDLKTETMFVVVSGWLVSNIWIVLAANFHANAKKLQPLVWSIIAQLTLSQDNRVKHLRFLWLKQAQILDNQGGLALDAFGLRVTYVNIIQIIIWTITIIVLALKS